MIERLSPFRLAPKPNRAARRRAARGVLTAVALGLLVTTALPTSTRALTVFDPLNYQENLLAAARALEQINNQVRLLQGQAQMLLKMDQNLLRLGSTMSPDLLRSLAGIQTHLRAGEGIALQLRATEAAYERLFPKQVSAALSADDVLRTPRSAGRSSTPPCAAPPSCRARSPTASKPTRASSATPWPARVVPPAPWRWRRPATSSPP